MMNPRPAAVRLASDRVEDDAALWLASALDTAFARPGESPSAPGGPVAAEPDAQPPGRWRAPPEAWEAHRLHAMRRQVAAALDQNSALGAMVAATSSGRVGLLRTAVFTAQGDAALASQHRPSRPAISAAALHHVLCHYQGDPTVGVQPGDAFLFAETVRQGLEQPSLGMLMPCFHERHLVAWVACALSEEPGLQEPAAPGAAQAAAVRGIGLRAWAEGFSPLKVAEGWQLKADLLATLDRQPQALPHGAANLHAWLATCVRLCESLHGQLEHHGAEPLAGMLRQSLDRVGEAAADRLASWPQGTVRGDFYLQGTPQEAVLIKLALALTVKGRRCKVDLRGSACEIGNRPVNLPLEATRQCLLDALVQGPWRDLPNLPAVLLPFEWRADPGSLLACSPSAPVDLSGRTRAILTQAFARLLAKLGGLGPITARGEEAATGTRCCAASGAARQQACDSPCVAAVPDADAAGLPDPLACPPEQVLAEVQRGQMAPHQAWHRHGVVLQPSGLGVDLALTRAERDRRRQARLPTSLRWAAAVERHVRPGPTQGVPFFGRWNGEPRLHAGLQCALPGQISLPVTLAEPGTLPAACARLPLTGPAGPVAAGVRPGRAAVFTAPLTPAAWLELLHIAWRAAGVWRRAGLPWRRSGSRAAAARHRLRRQRLALAWCDAVDRLGPTVDKLARLIAARPDLVDSEVAAHLLLRHPPVAALPPLQAMRAIERSLGSPLRELFLRFDGEPLATSARSQLHGAVLPDGRRCTVRLKRPGLHDVMTAELGALSAVAGLLLRWPQASARHLGRTLSRMARRVQAGADFRAVAERHEHWAHQVSGFEGLRMPHAVPAFCSDTVLTLEAVRGLVPAAWLERLGGRDPALASRVYRLGWELQGAQILLQPGADASHLLIDPAGRLVLLDADLLDGIDALACLRWLRACMAAIAGDAALWLAAVWMGLPPDQRGRPLAPQPCAALVNELQRLFDHCAGPRLQDTTRLWRGTARLLAQRGVPLDDPLHRAMAAEAALAGLARLFDPAFDAAGSFQRELPGWAVEHGPLRPDDPWLLAATRRDLLPAIREALAGRFLPPYPAAASA